MEDLVGGAPGLLQDGPGLRLGGGLGLFLLLGQGVPVLLGFGGGLLHLPAELGGLALLLFHLLALLVQLGEHVLEADVLRAHPGGGGLDDLLRQAQPLGDGKGVGLPRDAHQQAVGGGQGLHVKLAGGVLHPRGGHGVDLQLGVVGGGGHQGPQAPGVLDDGGGQGGPLHGVGAAPQLVEEDEGVPVGLLEHAHDVAHVGGEGGQGLGDGLLVPDVRQHPLAHPDGAPVPHGDVEAALGHEGEQADGL